MKLLSIILIIFLAMSVFIASSDGGISLQGVLSHFIIVTIIVAPSTLVYAVLAKLLKEHLCKFYHIKLEIHYAFLVFLALGTLISLTLNLSTHLSLAKYNKLNQPLTEDFVLPSTVGLHFTSSKKSNETCNQLCKKMLYNKVVDRIVVVPNLEKIKNPSEINVVSYQIELMETCPVEYLHGDPRKFNIREDPHFQKRMNEGECLVRDYTKLSDVEIIIVKGQKRFRRGDNSTGLQTIRFLELHKKIDDSFQQIYRISSAHAIIYSYPLGYGLYSRSGRISGLKIGFFLLNLWSNDSREFSAKESEFFRSGVITVQPTLKQLPKT